MLIAARGLQQTILQYSSLVQLLVILSGIVAQQLEAAERAAPAQAASLQATVMPRPLSHARQRKLTCMACTSALCVHSLLGAPPQGLRVLNGSPQGPQHRGATQWLVTASGELLRQHRSSVAALWRQGWLQRSVVRIHCRPAMLQQRPQQLRRRL